jgi:hypothetical protein
MSPPFLTYALDGSEWSASHAGRFIPGEGLQFPFGYDSLRAPDSVLDDVEQRKILTFPGMEPWLCGP